MDIFNEDRTIRFGDIDQSDSLTLASTFDFFQEAAISHAEILGVGRDAMTKSGQVWILSRLSVFMERRPRFNEKIIARSWPRGSNKLFAIRDYDIRDEADNPVIRGRSAWLIVDLEKHRPLRPQALVEPLPPNEGNDALPGPQAGNNPPPSLPDRFAENVAPKDKDTEAQNTAPLLRRVAYSDIDYNGHMNNTRYIQWIQDVIDLEIFNKAKQIRLDINYLSEARYGETISLYVLPITDPSPDTAGTPAQCTAAFAIEGRRTTPENGDAVPVFRAELRTGL